MAGLTRTGPGEWVPVGRPAYLKQQVELNLRALRVDRIDLIQLHRIDGDVPLEDQLGAFAELKEQGKVRHIGVSEVTVDDLKRAQQIAGIVSVQNLQPDQPPVAGGSGPCHRRGDRLHPVGPARSR